MTEPRVTPVPPPAAGAAGRRPPRPVLAVVLPLAALGAVWWFTRDVVTPPPAAGGHDHAAMMARDSSSAGRMVMLSADQSRRIGVTFAPVERREMPREVRSVGQVTADETRTTAVSSRVDGWVEAVYADFTGRAVRAGDSLVRVYSPMLVAAQEEFLVARRLSTAIDAGTPEARVGAADLLAAARARLLQWDVPEALLARIERTGRAERAVTIVASSPGVVVEKNVVAGQRVMSGDALYRLADLGTVWIQGEVYEQDLQAVRVGHAVTAEFDAYPGERWSGRISWIAPVSSPETRTTRVRVVVANERLRLKPGMAATLTIVGAAAGATPVLVVPRTAVLVTGERALVFVKRGDGQLEPRQVTLGATTHELIEILGGVALGDTVVASATFLVDAESNLGTALGGMGDMPGMEITVPPRAGPAANPPAAPPRKER
ncbi:MAG: efflux RND transporter periplasmic adaptor subunit [Gemmatimonadetes bacterium]|nr:efflux RND transporter periplasmic adaptor subunit [Gemmatimonadota bacterium]